MKRRAWLTIAAIVCMFGLLTACGDKGTSPGNQGSVTEKPPVVENNSNNETPKAEDPKTPSVPATPETPAETPEKKDQSITVYASDDELMNLTSYTVKITFADQNEKLKAALEALQKPKDSSYIALWAKTEFKTIKLDESGTLIVDIHIPDEARLGAGGEAFALDALTKTMFQFDEVKAINLLIDGKEEESLMGHVTLDHPIKRTP